MSPWGSASGILFALSAAGCATPPQPTCESLAQQCQSPPGQCTPPPQACAELPAGVNHALVEIASSPTSADIYVNGTLIGRTPLLHPLWYTSRTRFITLTAEPLFAAQAPQEYKLRVPPIPARIQFFMNNPIQVEAESAP